MRGTSLSTCCNIGREWGRHPTSDCRPSPTQQIELVELHNFIDSLLHNMDTNDQMCVTLQMGVHKEHLNIDKDADPGTIMELIRGKAKVFVERHCSDKEINDRLLLFRHDYDSSNLLQLLQSVDQLNNGSVIEVVLSSKDERPTRPHILSVHSYISPTFCDYCGEMLVGLVRQGLKCSKCHLNFHKKCAFAPRNNCSSDSESTISTGLEQVNGSNVVFGLPHTFVVHSYKKPTICKHCGNLLVGLMKQGLQCRDCKVNVHKKCAAQLPYDCRASEGLLARPSATTSELMETEIDMSAMSLDKMAADETLSTGDLIPLSRIPGQACVRHSRPPRVLVEGWLLHFTNHQPERRLRHYWILEPESIHMYQEGLHRCFKIIHLSEILGIRSYEGTPLDQRFPPHCFEIQTKDTIYYVGENLDWYARNGQGEPPAAKLPRRESGMGLVSATKWLNALNKALLPPASRHSTDAALEFSQLYQVNVNEELGSGQFGTVYGGVHRRLGKKVAIKVMAKDRFGRKQREQLQSEVAILQEVTHPGIIQLESMFETKDRIFVVMEKMKADMLEMILSSRLGRLTERVTKFLIYQILAALKYLHTKDIAHCDLKPENVLLSSPDTDFPQTKLCDFGYARFIGESQFRKTVVGTPAYLAPEVLQKRGYNKSLDMWSVGVVIYVTLSGTFPFNEGEEICDQIQNAEFMYPNAPWSEISHNAIDLISRLLKVKIEERLTIDECLAHNWLHDPQLVEDLTVLESRVGTQYLTSQDILPSAELK